MKKKKVVAIIGLLVLSMSATMLTGCGKTKTTVESSESSSSVAELPETANDETLVVGFDANFPPYGYEDENGDYVGFDLDLAAEVADRQGWELKLQPIDWDSKDMELESGNIDCIWNGFTIEGREDDYTWSEAYVDNSQVVVVGKDSGIKTLDDLKDKIVAVQAASSALSALESEELTDLTSSFTQLLEVKDYNSAFMNMETGSVDAIAMDIGVAQYQIETRDSAYVILEESLVTEQYGVGFQLGNTELRDKVQASLTEMVEDGTFDEIAAKWELTDSVILGK